MQREIERRLHGIVSALTAMVRVPEDRLSRAERYTRLRVTGRTLTARVRRGDVPASGADGKWLLAEVIGRESCGR
jgi:hypothetical protein